MHLVDPSIEALEVARRNLYSFTNCDFNQTPTEDLPVGRFQNA
jgi:hypothetical protein